MKQLYEVYIEQRYIIYQLSLILRRHIREKICCDKVCEKILLAEDESDAINQYKARYKWKREKPVDLWALFEQAGFESLTNEVIATPVKSISFNKLKESMEASDFLEYCKQEMFPTEVIINNI